VAGRVRNYNALVGEDGYVGVKTGSDAAAGGCLVFAKRAIVAGRSLTVLGVVLGQRSGAYVEAALASARRLGDSAASALAFETALPAGSRVLDVSYADGQRTSARSASALRVLGWGGTSVRVDVAIDPSPTPPRAGQRLARVSVDGASASASTAALAARTLAGPSLGWRLSHLL
jgi:D-alanyl-D-alanine carboxypeptidase (penicillin-binding protein 5/6)